MNILARCLHIPCESAETLREALKVAGTLWELSGDFLPNQKRYFETRHTAQSLALEEALDTCLMIALWYDVSKRRALC